MARFEIGVLTQQHNLVTMMALSGKWVDAVRQAKLTKKLILDLDSSASEIYGQQHDLGSLRGQTIALRFREPTTEGSGLRGR